MASSKASSSFELNPFNLEHNKGIHVVSELHMGSDPVGMPQLPRCRLRGSLVETQIAESS